MRTAEFLEGLLDRLPPDCVLVSSLGRTGEELFRLARQRTLFTDTMGDVAALATGIAISAKPMPVAGIDTDGSFLMNLSVLPTLGGQLPGLDNLTLAIMDNGKYESAGGMPSRAIALDWRPLLGAVGLTALIVKKADEIPPDIPKAGVVIIAEVVNGDALADSVKTIDGIESSYVIERYIAERRSAPLRRPAVKS